MRLLTRTRAVLLLSLLLLVLGCKSESDVAGDSKGKTSGSDKGGDGADTGKEKGQGHGGSSGEEKSQAEASVGTVHIDPANLSRAGIRIAPVTVRQMQQQLSANGQVAMDERHTYHIGSRADGVVERVMVLPGDAVRAGQLLALLHSHSVHETAGALAQAFAAVERQSSAVQFTQANRERYQRLLGLQVASQEEAQRAEQELQQAQQQLADANATVHMEQEHLRDRKSVV